MPDFSSLTLQANIGTESTPSYTGTAIQIGTPPNDGTKEVRFCDAGAGGASIASAAWPLMNRPGTVKAVGECWFYPTADNSGGLKVATYPTIPTGTGNNGNARVFRWNVAGDGTYVTPPQFTCFAQVDSQGNHPTPVPGQQTTATGAGGPIINGQSADTGNTSYFKAQVCDSGCDAAGAQQTPGAGTLTVPIAANDGTSGAVTGTNFATGGNNGWIATHWQSLQGWLQYVAARVIPKALTAHQWYWSGVLYTGPNMLASAMTFTLTFNYSF